MNVRNREVGPLKVHNINQPEIKKMDHRAITSHPPPPSLIVTSHLSIKYLYIYR